MRTVPDDNSWITNYLTAVGDRVRTERLRQNLTQERVYLAAGIDRRTLQAIEAGQGNPTAVTLLRIAYVLDTPLSELVAEPQGPAAEATEALDGGPAALGAGHRSGTADQE